MATADFLVIGGGVIGLNIGRRLRREFPDSKTVLIEKEPDCGLHASGRNSGVLHAGFYYSPDSLKARFTRIGNQRLTEYCTNKKIPLNKCGKLVVAKSPVEIAGLDELFKRGKANGIPLEMVTEKDAKLIEPRVKTWERALFSPSTATVDPTLVMEAMIKDALDEGVDIRCGVSYVGRRSKQIETSAGMFDAGYVVNAAGLYADRIGRDFGFSDRYRILPFKGLYLYSSEPPGSIRTNIYPVPDLKHPFLGVHFTVAANGAAKIGPTAIPVLWREHYTGAENFRLNEFLEIAARGLHLLARSQFDFKSLAIRELSKCSKSKMVSLASELMEGVRPEQYQRWGKPGIRAQLVDITKQKLEMDFVLEGDGKSMHVLNAVSPAFTCSLPFAEFVCERIRASLN
jgi:L-2-hydroxyglutarate oxidase LhgO